MVGPVCLVVSAVFLCLGLGYAGLPASASIAFSLALIFFVIALDEFLNYKE